MRSLDVNIDDPKNASMNVLLFLFIGLGAGAIAAKAGTANGSRRTYFAVGVSGAILGGFLLSGIGLLDRGLFPSLFTATAGAIVLLLLLHSIPRITGPSS